MAQLKWSPDALGDLEYISDYISLDSEEYATVFIRRIFSMVEILSVFPLSGRIVPEFEKQNVREKMHKSYRVIYKVNANEGVDILRIFHQAQQLNINIDQNIMDEHKS